MLFGARVDGIGTFRRLRNRMECLIRHGAEKGKSTSISGLQRFDRLKKQFFLPSPLEYTLVFLMVIKINKTS